MLRAQAFVAMTSLSATTFDLSAVSSDRRPLVDTVNVSFLEKKYAEMPCYHCPQSVRELGGMHRRIDALVDAAQVTP